MNKIFNLNPKDLKLSKEVKDEDLAGLIESIKSKGLFHTPLVKSNKEVIAGNKRVRAAQILNLPEISCIVYESNLSQETYKILALHENLNRENLPWYEQVIMEAQLHALRVAEHGAASTKRKDRGGSGWGLRDTAQELKISFGGLSQDIKLAEAFIADPSLAKIQDKRTALKIILQQTRQLAQESVATGNTALSEFIHGSSEVVLQAYSDNTFDVCLTDPPWLEFHNKDLIKDKFTSEVFKQVFRVLKPGSFLLAFVSTQDWYVYQKEFEEIGFSVQKWPLIWIKENSMSRGSTTWQTQRNYEPIILAVKGCPALTEAFVNSTFSCPIVHSGKMIHPNEKPIDIIKKLLLLTTFENALILDPFGGSGVVGEVCESLKRKYVIIEKNPEYAAKIKQRLEKKLEKNYV